MALWIARHECWLSGHTVHTIYNTGGRKASVVSVGWQEAALMPRTEVIPTANLTVMDVSRTIIHSLTTNSLLLSYYSRILPLLFTVLLRTHSYYRTILVYSRVHHPHMFAQQNHGGRARVSQVGRRRHRAPVHVQVEALIHVRCNLVFALCCSGRRCLRGAGHGEGVERRVHAFSRIALCANPQCMSRCFSTSEGNPGGSVHVQSPRQMMRSYAQLVSNLVLSIRAIILA